MTMVFSHVRADMPDLVGSSHLKIATDLSTIVYLTLRLLIEDNFPKNTRVYKLQLCLVDAVRRRNKRANCISTGASVAMRGPRTRS